MPAVAHDPRRRRRAADGARADARSPCAAVSPGSPRCCAGAGAVAADVLAVVLHARRAARPGGVSGPMVWGIIPGDAGHRARSAGARDAPRRPGSADRSAAAVKCPTRPALPRSRRPAASCGRRAWSTRSAATATGSRASALDDGTEIDAPIVVSACDPHDTFLDWLHEPARQPRDDLVRRWRTSPTTTATSRRSTLIVDAVPPTPWLATARSGRRTMIAPGLAEIDRGAALMAEGRVLDRPAHAGQRPDARSTRRWRPRRPSRVQPRSALHPVRAAGRLDRSRPNRGAGWSCSTAAANRASSTRSSNGGR